MGLNIKNQETERLARELAAATGESLTQAISTAVRERLGHIQAQSGSVVGQRTARLRAIAADAAGRWVEPYRTGDHGSLLYDDLGLPR